MEYLLMLMIFLVTGVFILWKSKIKVFNSKKEAVTVLGIFFLVGIVCDSIAVWRGYWTFQNVLSFRLGFLPLEEYIFFIVLPLWIIIFYKAMHENIFKGK